MTIKGLKGVVRSAFEARKFMTNGHPLPEIDFSRPVTVEITAYDSLGLYPTVVCKDDHVIAFGKRFKRDLYLQMTTGSLQEAVIVQLVCQNRALAKDFENVKKVHVCIRDYAEVGQCQARIPREALSRVPEPCVRTPGPAASAATTAM